MAEKFIAGFYNIKKEFFDKHLSQQIFMAPFNYGGFFSKYKPVQTDIICPFCKEGILELTNKKKDICEVHVCHNGNSYEFRCSNHCNEIIFNYTEKWLYC